jgi:AraC-like DNA-binding protein
MVIHLSSYPRAWGGGPILEHVKWIETKDYWYEHVFEHYCAMFILKGRGRVFVGDEAAPRAMEAPFVLLARPGRRCRYGPEGTWDEFSLVFEHRPSPDALAAFPEAPWPARAPALLREQVALTGRLLENPAVPGVADELDLVARLMLTLSWRGAGEDIAEGPDRRLYAAEAWMRSHLGEPFDLREVIRRFGFSEPTFRRLWRRHFRQSPWQYVLDLRLREARRLLRTEPGLHVGEIAFRCGFADRRHFATLFRGRFGRPPRAVRTRK